LEAISNFGETHLKIISTSEDILNKLDIKANPLRGIGGKNKGAPALAISEYAGNEDSEEQEQRIEE
jgi:hypothetical protein